MWCKGCTPTSVGGKSSILFMGSMQLFHRTTWKRALAILSEGIRPGHRVESGKGVYCVSSLEDCNRPYCKKNYGNTIVRIAVPDSLVWEYGVKVDFMRRTKEGDDCGNRAYKVPGTVGDVRVLYSTEVIESIVISRDNGVTWVQGEYCPLPHCKKASSQR